MIIVVTISLTRRWEITFSSFSGAGGGAGLDLEKAELGSQSRDLGVEPGGIRE